MWYCTKCRAVFEEPRKKCPVCRGTKLRPAAEEDMVLLQGADLYTAQRLAEAFAQRGIPCETQPAGHAYFSFDSQALPTDQRVFVPFARLEEAGELAARLARELEEEQTEEGAQEAEPPGIKRIVGEVLAVAAFLLLIVLAVFGADAAANWLKSLFSASLLG